MTAAESYGDTNADARRIVEALADDCQKCKRAKARGTGDVHCPAHDDAAPSLSVSVGRNGVVVNCHTGCSQDAVIAELRKRGLWHDAAQPHMGNVQRWAYSVNGTLLARHCRQDRPDGSKRYWWELPDGAISHGDVHAADLPLYGLSRIEAHPELPVLLCEGEKAADAGTLRGFLTGTLGGGASQSDFGKALAPLAGRDVVLLPDNDLPGRDLMRKVQSALRGLAASVRLLPLPGLPPKGDLFDYFADGGTANGLRELLEAPAAVAVAVPPGRPAPTPKRARDLQQRGLPAIGFAVNGILPEGVTLCAGRPKQGKSFLALNLAIAVAAGGVALGDLPVTQGDVLYLTLEGGEHGFLPRLNTMLAGELAPEALEYETEWPLLNDGGTEELERWLTGHPQARLVIIDTLQRLRPPTSNKLGAYEQDYAALQPLLDLSQRFHVAILIIHHTRKMAADDPLDTVSGTTGLTGSVDAVWVLQRVRGQSSATLTIAGRSVPESDLGLEWDATLCSWGHVGSAADVKRSTERRMVLDILRREAEPQSAREVADALDQDYHAVRKTLWRMSRSGELLQRGGGYVVAEEGTGSTHINEVDIGPNSPRVDMIDSSPKSSNADHVLGHGTGDSVRARDPARTRFIVNDENAVVPTRPGFLRLSVATKADCCGQPGFWMADDTRRVYCPVHVPPSKPLEESP